LNDDDRLSLGNNITVVDFRRKRRFRCKKPLIITELSRTHLFIIFLMLYFFKANQYLQILGFSVIPVPGYTIPV